MFATRTRTTSLNRSVNNTDIIYALSTDDYDELTKLINKNNVNKIIDSKNSYTALHYAVKFNNNKIIEFLLKLGADPELKTSEQQDAYDLSLKYQNKYVITYILNEKNDTHNDLKKVVSSLERKVNDLQTNNNYLIESIDEMGVKSSILKSEINTLKKAISDSNSKNISLTKELNTIYSDKSKIQDKNTQLKTEVDSLKNEVTILNNENQKLHLDIKTLKRKYDSLDDSYTGLLTKIKK
jgi:ankyrin repeat protein